MEHSIRHEFNLTTNQMVRIDQYQALAHNQMLYVIIPVQEEEQLEIMERYEMTKHYFYFFTQITQMQLPVKILYPIFVLFHKKTLFCQKSNQKNTIT